jgi:hypothetical protein
MVHNSSTFRDVPLPGFFTSSENDDITSSTKGSSEDHAAAGYDTTWKESLEVPWTPEHPLMHPSYDAEEAQDVFDELVTNGLIDADGGRLVDLGSVESALRGYENNSELNGPARMTTLIRVAWATHRPTSEFACEERTFMLDNL